VIELILPPKPKMMITGVSAYSLYLTLKNHYAGKYDVVKYNWSPIKVSQAAFNKSNSRFFFERMAKKFTLGDLAGIMTVNFASNPDAWGGDIASADAVSFYNETCGKITNMRNTLTDEVDGMLMFGKAKGIKFKDLLFSSNGQPWIFKFVQQRIVSYETMIVLDNLFQFIDSYDSMKDHVWANGYADRIKAYRKLCLVNKSVAKATFMEIAEKFRKYSN
jgi:hypothetical protein